MTYEQCAKLIKVKLNRWKKKTPYDFTVEVKKAESTGDVMISVDNLKFPITYNMETEEFVVYKQVFGLMNIAPWKFIIGTKGEAIADEFKQHIERFNSEERTDTS